MPWLGVRLAVRRVYRSKGTYACASVMCGQLKLRRKGGYIIPLTYTRHTGARVRLRVIELTVHGVFDSFFSWVGGQDQVQIPGAANWDRKFRINW